MTAGRKVSSLSQDWGTPPKYVNSVKQVFGGKIDLDPCSNDKSIVYARVEYKLPKIDGLKAPWNYRTIYVNPPYGADRASGTTIRHWLRRCAEAHDQHGAEVLALVPVATNTRHWKKYVWTSATAVAFLYDTRLRFLVDGKDEGKGAPMSCAMIYWGEHYATFFDVFQAYGAVVDVRALWGRRIGEAGRATQLHFVTES